MTEFERTLRTVVDLCAQARQDAEQIVGTRLPNVEHYALLGRLDALSADVTRFVADTLTAGRLRGFAEPHQRSAESRR